MTAAPRCYYADQPTARPNCRLTATARVGHTPLCPSCLAMRSTLGKGQPVRPRPTPGGLDPPDPLEWITQAAADLRAAEHTLAAAVHRARHAGHSWAQIGERLHITRQAAQQRFHGAPHQMNQHPRGGDF